MVRPQSRRERDRDGRYKGVRMRKWGKWVAEVRQPNSRDRIWLGSYESAVEAARAYDAAVFCLRGPSAVLNFPDDPPDILSADELSPSQIQVAASRHARRLVGGAPAAAAAQDQLKQPVVENLFFAEPAGSSSFGEFHGGQGYLAAEGIGRGSGAGGAEEAVASGVYFESSRMWNF